MKVTFLFAGLLLIIRANAQKESKGTSVWGFVFYYDQDSTLEQLGLRSVSQDRNYTMGLGLGAWGLLLFFRRLKSILYVRRTASRNVRLGARS